MYSSVRTKGASLLYDTDHVATYKEESDLLLHFLEASGYEFSADGSVAFGDVYHDYQQYTLTNGGKPVASKVFGQRLLSRFPQLEKKKVRIAGSPMTAYIGLSKVTKY